MFGAPFPGGAIVVHTLVDAQSGATSYTVNLGTAFSGRVIVLAITFGGVIASGITLAGNAMTRRIRGNAGASGDAHIWTITDTVNSSATLALTGAGSANGFALYTLQGAASETPNFTSGVAANNTTLNVPANGSCIGSFYSNNSTTGATWTGLTRDTNYNLTGVEGSQASKDFLTAQSPLSVSVSSSGAVFGLATASWGP